MKSDTDWIAAALDRYEKPLLRYAAWLLDDRERARDIVQEVFLRLCKASRAQVEDHVAEWLFKVCRNLSFDVRERENRRRELDTEQAFNFTEILAGREVDAAAQKELLKQILAIIETLPANQREVVFLKFREGFSYKEISQLTGLSNGNVGFLIHAAIETIRSHVQSVDSRSRISVRRRP